MRERGKEDRLSVRVRCVDRETKLLSILSRFFFFFFGRSSTVCAFSFFLFSSLMSLFMSLYSPVSCSLRSSAKRRAKHWNYCVFHPKDKQVSSNQLRHLFCLCPNRFVDERHINSQVSITI